MKNAGNLGGFAWVLLLLEWILRFLDRTRQVLGTPTQIKLRFSEPAVYLLGFCKTSGAICLGSVEPAGYLLGFCRTARSFCVGSGKTKAAIYASGFCMGGCGSPFWLVVRGPKWVFFLWLWGGVFGWLKGPRKDYFGSYTCP